MRTILKILYIEKRADKNDKPYARTTALLDDGTEATGFGNRFKVGDKVEVFYHYGTVKMRLPLTSR